jgi:hypothetical protein
MNLECLWLGITEANKDNQEKQKFVCHETKCRPSDELEADRPGLKSKGRR